MLSWCTHRKRPKDLHRLRRVIEAVAPEIIKNLNVLEDRHNMLTAIWSSPTPEAQGLLEKAWDTFREDKPGSVYHFSSPSRQPNTGKAVVTL